MQRKINLSYDMLIGLLQGKEIHLVDEGNHIVIAPPFDGVFLTRDQIQEIEYSSEKRIFDMLEKVMKAREQNYPIKDEK